MTAHWAQASASVTLAKIMAGGAEMWLNFAFMFEVYINTSALIFPHTYFKLNLAFIFLPL